VIAAVLFLLGLAMNYADHRIAFVKGGIGYFAKVGVRVQTASPSQRVTARDPRSYDDQFWVEDERKAYSVPSEWRDAAIRGARKVARWHEAYGMTFLPADISVVIGTVCDTREDIVECAAVYATWKLQGHDITQLALAGDRKAGFSVILPDPRIA
jgi:hypothetical protein